MAVRFWMGRGKEILTFQNYSLLGISVPKNSLTQLHSSSLKQKFWFLCYLQISRCKHSPFPDINLLFFCFFLCLLAGISVMEENIFCAWTVHVCCFWQCLFWLPWIRRALHISPSFYCWRGMVWGKGECLCTTYQNSFDCTAQQKFGFPPGVAVAHLCRFMGSTDYENKCRTVPNL